MSSPPIQYHGPAIDPSVPWHVSVHLEQMYLKFGNHTQAISLLNQKIAALKAGTTNTVIEGGGGGGGTVVTENVLSVNNQSGVTTYTTVSGDDAALLVLSDASPVAVTLASQTPPWGCFVANQGAGTATLTPASGTISYAGNPGAASMPLPGSQACMVAFDGTNWFAWSWAITADQLPAMVEFQLADGTAGSDVAGIALAWHTGSVSSCVVAVDASDAGTAFQFAVTQNGTDVFAVDPTLAAGTAPGTVTSFALSGTKTIAVNDLFRINVLTGTSSWKVTIQLR